MCRPFLHVANDPAFVFPMARTTGTRSRPFTATWVSQSNIHETLAFLPWHREFVNRYELLLQQYDPTVKLLFGIGHEFRRPSLSFMGSYSGVHRRAVPPSSGLTLSPPSVTRSTSGSLPAESDSAVLARTPYDPFQFLFLHASRFSALHVGLWKIAPTIIRNGHIGGNMNFPSISAEDPFFFCCTETSTGALGAMAAQSGEPARSRPGRRHMALHWVPT